MKEFKDDYSEMIETTIENLNCYAGAILNDRHELIEDEDPFFFLLGTEDDKVMEINSLDRIQEEIKDLKIMKQGINIGALEGRLMRAFAEKNDVEPDYDNPIESYSKLDELKPDVADLNASIKDKLVEKFDIEPDLVYHEYDRQDYQLQETFFYSSDCINTLPLIEGIVDSEQNIEREKENLLAKAVDEHREQRQSLDSEYRRPEIPLNPVRWEEVIDEESIGDFMDISDLPSVTYGDSLHLMMEETVDDLDRVESEYPLHFLNPGERDDLPIGNRVDNTLRPDALGDIFVYEFKHMPSNQQEYLHRNGNVEMNRKHSENIQQANLYLNEMDLPAGMLVYVCSDMEVEEYVIERHDNELASIHEDYLNEHVHRREDYNFEIVFSNQ